MSELSSADAGAGTLRSVHAYLDISPPFRRARVGQRERDDLYPGVLAAAAWPAIQRAAILGGVQRAADRVLPHFRVAFPRAVSCAVHSRFGRGAHEARGPQASRDR